MRSIYIEPIKINKKNLRKSYKFQDAYQIEGRKGHYFIKAWQPCNFDDNMVIVPWVFYQGRWYRDWVYFNKKSLEKLLVNC